MAAKGKAGQLYLLWPPRDDEEEILKGQAKEDKTMPRSHSKFMIVALSSLSGSLSSFKSRPRKESEARLERRKRSPKSAMSRGTGTTFPSLRSHDLILMLTL
jgi:hypothetical protein